MKDSPRNKMISNGDESTKAGATSKKSLGKKVHGFYFPHYQREVQAETFEEAVAIINQEEKKKNK